MDRLQLSSLVDELLLAIIEQIDSHEALCNVAATCSRFRYLAEPFIWRKLLVLNGAHASHIALALEGAQQRMSYIQELSIHYKHDVAIGIDHLNPFIYGMDKLRRLTIETPCPNNGEWRHEALFTAHSKINYERLFNEAVSPTIPTPPLQMLQSVSLHGHGRNDAKFNIGSVANLFLHPTVVDITISCIDFGADPDIELTKATSQKLKSTALRSLKLIECNVYLDLLELALGLPRALKHLQIGERLHAFEECIPELERPMTGHPRFLEVLQQQADSLESLQHTSGRYSSISDSASGPLTETLQTLHSLKYLKADSESLLLASLIDDGCPESLQTLKITDDVQAASFIFAMRPGFLYFSKFLKNVNNIAGHLRPSVNIDLCFSHHSRFLPLTEELSNFWRAPQSRQIVYQVARTLQSKQSRLRIFAEQFLGGASFIEPYMYGEERPTEVLLYDSDKFWTFIDTDYQTNDEEGVKGGSSMPDPEAEESDGEETIMLAQQDYIVGLDFGMGNATITFPFLQDPSEHP